MTQSNNRLSERSPHDWYCSRHQRQKCVDKRVYCVIHCNTHYSSWNKMVCLLVFIIFFSFILFWEEIAREGRGWVQRYQEMSWNEVHDLKFTKKSIELKRNETVIKLWKRRNMGSMYWMINIHRKKVICPQTKIINTLFPSFYLLFYIIKQHGL